MRDRVQYLSGGTVHTIDGFDPKLTLLDHIRLTRRTTGTKEGCNEGDCGACTVVLGRLRDGAMVYEPVNACIMLAGMIDGCELITVEDLAGPSGLHPVQAAMVAHHGSQCGFCTPGIVMSLFALYEEGVRPVTRQVVTDQLAGNLCRCTGYRPIIDAALAACAGEVGGAAARDRAAAATVLADLADEEDIFIGNEQRFFAAPASIDALAELYQAHPDATLVAGATDVGLWITKQLRDIAKVIWLGRVGRLDRFVETPEALSIGATVTHARAEAALGGIDPDLGELMRRFGSRQVRASGTIGGSIANGSPIGDLAPAMIALGAKIYLRMGSEGRAMPLESFFIAYGKQDRRPGEFVVGVAVTKLRPDEAFRCYKVSKRFDEDISAVMGAFKFSLLDGVVADARVAFGGMAATPKRASATEEALIGAVLDDGGTWTRALDAIAEDFQPIDDVRASAAYRGEVARALLLKALVEVAGAQSEETRLIGRREASHVAA
ncbi:xanthine dehydrogenase small subunit [Labrys wisconsinensis]|uniref:Xanthine dehydrogenase small subunit n=1 Tax=Labrys wisconsinensis TaxID=425677 RepID=A0ABU0J4T8_9HYPH|nr:xanthine dehydrogenase small subunit [Labrys wisconsinensis]MDQ0469281.1 xanthine dehydrogenase small subunit [Labrys wisconsinensis]